MITFVHYLDIPRADYLAQAKMSLISIRKTNPTAQVKLITNSHCIQEDKNTDLFGYDSYIKMPDNLRTPYWFNRTKYSSEMPCDNYVFLDVDMLVLGSLDHVFEEDFKIACTTRSHPHPRLPKHNWGIVFTKTPGFFKFLVEDLSHGRDLRQFDIEKECSLVVEQNTLEGYFKELNGRRYNFIVDTPVTPIDEDTLILHFKGVRKKHMEKYYRRYFTRQLVSDQSVN